ncbi:uncharacterized protein Z518_03037 [Rhinocladiella mackenziei CBS 650.93]|uniref:Histone H4 n=1 Tax=Rhinocladiella mackenziei CBS 650.93 TaxID=1442369 RepID=A0A0D2IYB2_9EURO|nr:uncharacterized protein Z518_03037 [Rhinocladiella mackenziei CBS 650.93]KIX08381.1 hypothetical protein Z518_03037 [Rhinocladiella mackenziei CBS 650.93]
MPVPTPIYGDGPNRLGAKISNRHRVNSHMRYAINGITKPTIRRLARKGGIYRIRSDIHDTVRGVLQKRLEEIIRKIIIVISQEYPPDHPNCRKTVTTQDVVFVLYRMGRTLYGFDQPYSNKSRRAILPWQA